MLRRLAYAAVTALSLADAILAVPEEALAPVQVLETRRHTRTLDERALQNMRRDFVTASLKQRDSDPEVYKTNGSLDLSWNDAELFSYGVLAVTCAECYVKGTVHATLTFETDFNISKAFTHFIGEFGSEIINITEQVWDEFVDWAGEVYENTTDTILEDVKDAVTFQWDDFKGLDWDAYAYPTWNVSLDMPNMTDIPETTIQLQFDGLELYMLLDVALSAEKTWTIPLYPKSWYQPAGFAVGDQKIGIIIALDLILELDLEVDLSTGVHIAFDDGLTMELAMFGSDVSTINLSDGSFEFLPVTVNTSGVVFDATLRLSVTAGLNMSADLGDIELGAGASATVYADLARFRTNVTLADESHILKARDGTSYSDDCELPVVESYEFGLGALAGAFVEFDQDTWGPTPNTSIQIFYTTLMSACATSATTTTSGSGQATSSSARPKRTNPPQIADRAGTSLTLASTPIVYTITNIICQSTGLRNCPASLQNTIQETKTSTYYTSLPSGSKITAVPETTTSGGVIVAQSFGSGMNKVAASSGSPKSYVPPSATSSTGPVESAIDDAKDDFDELPENKKQLIIGLSAGLGGVLLITLIAGVTICCRKRKVNKKRNADTANLLEQKTSYSGSTDSYQPFLTPSTKPKNWGSGSDLAVSYVEVRSPYDDPSNPPRQPAMFF